MQNQTVENALRGRMKSLSGKMERMREKVDKEQRDYTEEENALLESYMDEFFSCEKEINSIEKWESQPDPNFKPSHNEIRPQNRPHAIRPVMNPRAHFSQAEKLDGGGFANAGEFFLSVSRQIQGHHDRRIQAATYLEGEGSQGGFLVPQRFAAEILGPALVESNVLNRVDLVRMPGGNLAVAGFDTEDHSSGSIGGLTLRWTAEGSQLSAQTPSLRTINLRAKKGTVLVNASNELLADAPSAPAQLQDAFRQAAQHGLEHAVLVGTGAGTPQGAINSGAKIEVAKEGSQVADTINFENVRKMVSRIHPNLLPTAAWYANPSCLPELLKLQFRIENAAANDFVGGSRIDVMTDQSGVYRLLGIPLYFSESLNPLGDAGDLILGSFSQYIFAVSLDVAVDSSIHSRFDFDEVQFRLRVRCDGQSKWSSALTPRNGDSLSWIVTLAERA